MTKVIEFRAAARSSSVTLEQGRSADVVLFPGVRYERWTESAPAAKRGRRSRERDTLELAD